MEKENKEWRRHLEGNDWTASGEIIKREKIFPDVLPLVSFV